MKKISYKGRCEKQKVSKCKEVCRTYNQIQSAFTSGDNTATEEYKVERRMERCPYCGVALDENGVCYKCGYVK